jgi:hypothetical protein
VAKEWRPFKAEDSEVQVDPRPYACCDSFPEQNDSEIRLATWPWRELVEKRESVLAPGKAMIFDASMVCVGSSDIARIRFPPKLLSENMKQLYHQAT